MSEIDKINIQLTYEPEHKERQRGVFHWEFEVLRHRHREQAFCLVITYPNDKLAGRYAYACRLHDPPSGFRVQQIARKVIISDLPISGVRYISSETCTGYHIKTQLDRRNEEDMAECVRIIDFLHLPDVKICRPDETERADGLDLHVPSSFPAQEWRNLLVNFKAVAKGSD